MANFNYQPLSLQNVVLGRLASDLLRKPNILSSIGAFDIKSPPSEEDSVQIWRETVEAKLENESSKFGLPKTLSQLVIRSVKLMAGQVKIWKYFHEEYLRDSNGAEMNFGVPILKKLCWTAAWDVDYRKTAEEIVRSNAVHVVRKFKLACLYCLEDCVSLYWSRLSKEYQTYFFSRKMMHLFDGGLGLEFFWPYFINGQESRLGKLTRSYRYDSITIHQYAFKCSVIRGNKAAADYFFQKLTQADKDASLVIATKSLLGCSYRVRCTTRNDWHTAFPLDKSSELLRYLLSIMTPDERTRIFHEKPGYVLEWFLSRPLQDMFLVIADIIWPCLPDSDRDQALCVMYRNIKNSGDYCVKVTNEFFRRIPSDFWIGFVDRQCKSFSYFGDVFFDQDVKAVEIIFRSLDDAARRRLVGSQWALETFRSRLSKGELGFVEACIREVNLSQEDKRKLKEDFMRHLTSIKVNEMRLKTRKWSAFFRLLDETSRGSKRCSEQEMPSDSKKKKG